MGDGLDTKRVEDFLMNLANLRLMWRNSIYATAAERAGKAGSLADAQHIVKYFPEFFPKTFPADSEISMGLRQVLPEHVPGWENYPQMAARAGAIVSLHHIHYFAERLRRAWSETDERLREYSIFELRQEFHKATDPDHPNNPPALTPFEHAMFFLQRNLGRARKCANPECDAPYFFSKQYKPQRYCDPKCAGTAKREAKRRWWANNRSKSARLQKGGKHGK